MKNSARPVSSLSWNSCQRRQRTTGAFSASGRMRLGGKRRLACSRWENWDFIKNQIFHLICFQIVPTGKPSPLTACQIVNKTLTSLKVQCQEGKSLFGAFCRQPSVFISGFDGGLPANFLLELYDAEKMELKSQVTNKVPIFEVISINIWPKTCHNLKSPWILFANIGPRDEWPTKCQYLRLDKYTNNEMLKFGIEVSLCPFRYPT